MRDAIVIIRSLAIFAGVVIFGVSVAETQINSLTNYRQFSQAFNFRREAGSNYSLYLFGNRYGVNAVIPLGIIRRDGEQLSWTTDKYQFRLPVRLTMDISSQLTLVNSWSDKYRDRANQVKGELMDFWRQMREKMLTATKTS